MKPVLFMTAVAVVLNIAMTSPSFSVKLGNGVTRTCDDHDVLFQKPSDVVWDSRLEEVTQGADGVYVRSDGRKVSPRKGLRLVVERAKHCTARFRFRWVSE